MTILVRIRTTCRLEKARVKEIVAPEVTTQRHSLKVDFLFDSHRGTMGENLARFQLISLWCLQSQSKLISPAHLHRCYKLDQ